MKLIKGLLVNHTTPTVKKRWVFTSFGGHYSDNPKYLSLKLHELDPSIEIIWLVNKEYMSDVPSFFRVVEFGTDEAIKYAASAEVIIDNVYGNAAFFKKRNGIVDNLKSFLLSIIYINRKQRIYTTWHGTPLKRMGRDQIGNDITGVRCGNIRMILGNRFTMKKMRHITFNKIPMKVMGTPRNDILFLNKRDEYCDLLDLPRDKRIILFAPTFRNDGKDTQGKNIDRSGLDQLNSFDFDRLFSLLNIKFGGDWVMVCRFHYHVAELVDWESLNKKYNGRIINGNAYDDMAQYLLCADILLTDASSCMFDYVLTGKPCFIYFPDIANYERKERGFYFPINILPFSTSVNFKELLSNISSFDNKRYLKEINMLMKRLGYCEDGNASERIIRQIFKDLKYK